MQITFTLPERVAREAERLALETETSVAELCARAVEESVKQMSQQRALDLIDALLRSGTPVGAPNG